MTPRQHITASQRKRSASAVFVFVARSKATLFDGSYHDVDSNEMAFKVAGSLAFKEVARKASPMLLEPVMAVEARVAEEFMGTIIGDSTRVADALRTWRVPPVHR